VDHAIGMHHLQIAVVERRGPGDVADLADRKKFFQVILASVEISDGQRVGVVARLDIVRYTRAMRRRRAMPVDRDGDGYNSVRRDFAELRLLAAVDETARQMEQQIDDTRRVAIAAKKARVELFELRPDPRQGRERREQRVEDGWTHGIPFPG